MKVKLQIDKIFLLNKTRRDVMLVFGRNCRLNQTHRLSLRFYLKLCHVCLGMSLSLCHPCYRNCRYRLYRVTTYEHYIVLDMREALRVNFLTTLNYFINVSLDVNMKRYTKVNSESDR